MHGKKVLLWFVLLAMLVLQVGCLIGEHVSTHGLPCDVRGKCSKGLQCFRSDEDEKAAKAKNEEYTGVCLQPSAAS